MKKPKRIMCIDDDPEVLHLMEMLLVDMDNAEVSTYTDAYAALDAMRNLAPDIVLLDVMMPDMNGMTAYRAMQDDEKLRQIKVVFVTARKRDGDMQQYEELGVPIITKPFMPADFQDAMKELI